MSSTVGSMMSPTTLELNAVRDHSMIAEWTLSMTSWPSHSPT
jgi:hypothetical protein